VIRLYATPSFFGKNQYPLMMQLIVMGVCCVATSQKLFGYLQRPTRALGKYLASHDH
jgi:hypothetical protein